MPTIQVKFSFQEIAQLRQLCEWLEGQPCHSAFSGEIASALPSLQHLVSHAWKPKRKSAGVIYYQVGYGWRLHKLWRERLDRLDLSRIFD